MKTLAHRRPLWLLALLALLALLVIAPALARPDPTLTRVVEGIRMHVGVMPVAKALKSAGTPPAQVMHAHKGTGVAAQHVVVALFDAKSSQRIGDAEVDASVTEVGFAAQGKPLVPMTVGGVISYGNTFEIKPGQHYTIRISVRRAGAHVPAATTFDYTRP